MEVKRQLDVLDKQLLNNNYICCNEYTIADIAIWPWYGALVLGRLYGAGEFLDVKSYKNVVRWALMIDSREAVKRGRMVNRINGELDSQLHERHDAKDFISKTQDKIQ
jgi:GST-like protein